MVFTPSAKILFRLLLKSPKAFKTARRAQLYLEFVILGLWFVCNLYFVICNFKSCSHATMQVDLPGGAPRGFMADGGEKK